MKMINVLGIYVAIEIAITLIMGRDAALMLFVATLVGIIATNVVMVLSKRKEDE